MNTTLLFFLLLIPLSGFIAWAGDKIGHRIGKRRQSLFGLRPRHTATLITIGAGIGITLTSFVGMWAISRSFRNVLARGATLSRDNQLLQDDNARLVVQISEAGRRVRSLRLDAEHAEVLRNEAVSQRARAEKDLGDARRRLRDAEETLKVEREQLAGTRTALETAQSRVRDAQARRDRAETAASAARERALQAGRAADAARQKVATAERVFEEVMKSQRERLEEQREQLRTLTVDIETQSKQLTEQRKRLAEQTTRIGEQDGTIQSQTARLSQQRAEVERLGAEVADLETKRAEYQAALAQLAESAEALRSRRITYRVGEEVARLSLSPGASIWKVQNALEGLMTAASKKAEARGARTTGGALRAVWIPSRQMRRNDGKIEDVTEMDALHAASMSIRGANEDVVIVVQAATNAATGEPVPVDLKTYRNPLLFTAGTVLGELTLSGRSTRQEVADALYTLLRRDVRRKLLRAGVIPASLGAGLDAEPVGEASIDALLKVMEDVRGAGRSRVVVRAAQDLRAADPVTLQFDVKTLEPAPIATETRDGAP